MILVRCNVVIRKNGGFYCVFDDDALIVSFLTGYKIVNGKCGFPLNSLNKVTNLLENNSINYVVRANMENESMKNYKKNNKYEKILDKGRKKFDIDYRVNSIIEKLSYLSYDKLSSLLDKIEEYCEQ